MKAVSLRDHRQTVSLYKNHQALLISLALRSMLLTEVWAL